MSDTAARQLVVFTLSGEQYALPINAVSEIIRFTEPRYVMCADPSIEGVIGLRGKIIPVFTLAPLLQLKPPEAKPGKIVIIENSAGHVGITVDEVDEVVTVTDDQLEESPTATTAAIEAIARIGDRLVILLDPEQLRAVRAEAALAAP
jgi:purine-binding chemotaxis protein CheW